MNKFTAAAAVNLRPVVRPERLWETRGSRLPLRGVLRLCIEAQRREARLWVRSLVCSTIKGSLPAFASGDVVDAADATDIHSITEWRSLSPSSVIRTAIGPSCDVLSPCGERWGFTLFRGNDTIG